MSVICVFDYHDGPFGISVGGSIVAIADTYDDCRELVITESERSRGRLYDNDVYRIIDDQHECAAFKLARELRNHPLSTDYDPKFTREAQYIISLLCLDPPKPAQLEYRRYDIAYRISRQVLRRALYLVYTGHIESQLNTIITNSYHEE